MKQLSHTNECHTLHKLFIYPIGRLDVLLYIVPKLLPYGLRHELPNMDGDGDIISNLKCASAFECFPYFRGFS
jgi:hypothetical protein